MHSEYTIALSLWSIPLPGKPPTGSGAVRITTTALDARVSIDLEAASSRLLNETRRLLADLSQRPLSNEQLADAVGAGLERLGPTLATKAGRSATSEAFNLGRNLAAQDLLSGIAAVVRVEILDRNTCGPCKDLDGTSYKVNSPEYFAHMPPNDCDGEGLCRGFYLYRPVLAAA